MDSFDISRLASEILLFIFLHLDLNQLVRSRRVSKQFLEVIDNNQPLWRVFEWIQQDQESFRPALDMFDQKSRSSLEKISIQGQNNKDEDILHLGQVLKRSIETLSEVTLKINEADLVGTQVVELVAAGSRLRSLVVWEWGFQSSNDYFPLSRLISSKSRGKTSSVGQLQLLWIDQDIKVDSKHLNSLVSFAQTSVMTPQASQKLIGNFSETVVHLRIAVNNQPPTIKPLLCPNLKVFEGWVADGVSSLLDAPQLQILILEDLVKKELIGLLPSVEEIWLRSKLSKFNLAEDWNPLLHHCPKLRILKLMEDFGAGFTFRGLLEVLQNRRKMVQDGKEIDGIKIVSLEKLILPTSLLTEKELKRAAKVAEEVIDVKDYKEFIDIEY